MSALACAGEIEVIEAKGPSKKRPSERASTPDEVFSELQVDVASARCVD